MVETMEHLLVAGGVLYAIIFVFFWRLARKAPVDPKWGEKKGQYYCPSSSVGAGSGSP